MLVRTVALHYPLGLILLPGECGVPRVELRCWERQVWGRPPSSPSNSVCSLLGAGYGSYGYGGNSATAGYSKCVFLLV